MERSVLSSASSSARRAALCAAAVAVAVVGAGAASAPASASASASASAAVLGPAGLDCGLTASTDPTDSINQPDFYTAVIRWGPVAAPGTNVSVRCEVRVNNVVQAFAGATGAVVITSGAAAEDFLATQADTISVCTDVRWTGLNAGRSFHCDGADVTTFTEDLREITKNQDTNF